MINKKQNQIKSEYPKNTNQQLQIAVEHTASNTISEQLETKTSALEHRKRQNSQARQTSNIKQKDSKDQIKHEQNPESMKRQKFEAGQFKKNVKLIFNLKKKIEKNNATSNEQILSDLQAFLMAIGPLAKFHDKLQKFTKFVVLSEEKLKEMQNLIENLQVQNKIIKSQMQKLQSQLKLHSLELHGRRTKMPQQKIGQSQNMQSIKGNQLISEKKSVYELITLAQDIRSKDSPAFKINTSSFSIPMFQAQYEKPFLIQFSQLQFLDQILQFKNQKKALVMQLNQLQMDFDQISKIQNINLCQLLGGRQLLNKEEAIISQILKIVAILLSLDQPQYLTKDSQTQPIQKENLKGNKITNSNQLDQSYLPSLARLMKKL